tara:strand:+ start:5709 stop:6161 length:453 start_codon:yes stop_codon:yes gene_type:complete
MSKAPKNNGQKSDGTFAPGNKLGGRPKGARNKATLAVEALLDGEAENITRKAVEMALTGDGLAMRLCLERLMPARKDSPVVFTLPPIVSALDAVTASSALLVAVAEGDVTPEEAGKIMGLLTSHKQLVEICDLESRVQQIEERKAVNGKP